ncbi:hypothetical protein HX744_04365 [Pseudonocardia sp. ICBG1122]|nr:hypothetical protein [Pseudonocardia pini]
MTDMWDDLFEPPDPADVLGDLHEVATSVFDLCYDGSGRSGRRGPGRSSPGPAWPPPAPSTSAASWCCGCSR